MSKKLLETANQKRGRSSKVKGAAGERELSKYLNDLLGLKSYRGRQYCGSTGAPDVVVEGVPALEDISGVHIECKRVENLNLYKAIAQSISDAREGEIPIVCHRRNREKWLISFELDELPRLSKWVSNLDIKEKDEPDGSEKLA